MCDCWLHLFSWCIYVHIYKIGSKGGFVIHASRFHTAVNQQHMKTPTTWTEQCCNAATHSSLIAHKKDPERPPPGKANRSGPEIKQGGLKHVQAFACVLC
jgi:hypothetical protein